MFVHGGGGCLKIIGSFGERIKKDAKQTGTVTDSWWKLSQDDSVETVAAEPFENWNIVID